MSKRPARRVLKAITAALLLVPLFAGLAPSAEAGDRVGRNNFCRASGHSTVTCNFVDDDDDDKDGDKTEIISIDIVLINVDIDEINVDIDTILNLENVIKVIVKDTVKFCNFSRTSNSTCVGLIVVNVSDVLNKNTIGWKKTCAYWDWNYACKYS